MNTAYHHPLNEMNLGAAARWPGGTVEYIVGAAWLAAAIALSFVLVESADMLAGLTMAALP